MFHTILACFLFILPTIGCYAGSSERHLFDSDMLHFSSYIPASQGANALPQNTKTSTSGDQNISQNECLRSLYYYDPNLGKYVPWDANNISEKNKTSNRISAEPSKEMFITIGNQEYTEEEFDKEYITYYEFNPETNKFKVHKCNQDKLREKNCNLVDKKYHKHHISRYQHPRRQDYSRAQWLRCRDCGKYLRGSNEAREHSIDTGHKLFDRIDF